MKTIVVAVILYFVLSVSVVKAQETVIATGDNIGGSGGTVSFSVGQIVYTSNTGISGSVAQGVQLPFEIMVVTSTEEAKDITLQCLIYPNPATTYLMIKLDGSTSPKFESLKYQLFDLNGRLLMSGKVEDNETSIGIGNLAENAYLLKIIDNNKEIKIFKIIKN